MNDLPLVSISCITFNHARYLRECFDGFLMQQTNFAFEVVIHDDASTDETKAIIEEYTQKHPTIFYPMYQTENQYSKGVRGFMAKFNIPRAKGKYIAFCEGDDYWTDPNKLQKQVDFLEANEDYIACFHNAWIENSIENKRYEYHPWKESRAITSKEVIEIGGYIFPTAALVFRKSAKIQPLENCSAGDLSIALDLLSQGKFYYFNDFMCVYRRHENGIYSGIIKDLEKMQKLQISVISLIKEKSLLFPKEYNDYFKATIKSKYRDLFFKYNYPFYHILKAYKYFSLREILSILKFKLKNE